MTTYANFVRDFPKRCKDLLDDYETDARGKDREVTLLIAVATSAFTIPFERLRPSSTKHVADDRSPEAVNELDRLENRYFVDWQTRRGWMIIENLDGNVIRSSQADTWANPDQWRPIPANKTVRYVLNVLRNALAHGSIFTFPSSSSGKTPREIKRVVFLSRIRDKKTRDKKTRKLLDRYNAVIASPTDFRTLIFDWVSLLEGLPLPSEIKQENI